MKENNELLDLFRSHNPDVWPASDNLALVPRGFQGIDYVANFGTVVVAVMVLLVATRAQLGYKSRPAAKDSVHDSLPTRDLCGPVARRWRKWHRS